jgi:DNA-directed RNA polymerase specialized sigma24 family protein
MPLLKQELERRWPALRALHDDVLGEIAVALVAWRAEARDGDTSKLRPEEPLDALAARLVNAQARKVRRSLRGEWEQRGRYAHEAPVPDDPGPEALGAEERNWVASCIDELPPAYAHALRVYLDRHAGDGLEAHVALECGKGAARMRISRAREALVARLRRPR